MRTSARSRAPVAAAGAVLLLAALTAAVAARAGSPFPVDGAVHRWVVGHRAAALTSAARALTATGTGVAAYALAALAGALAAGRRWWAGALAAVAALAVAQGVRLALAEALARPRPPRADWAALASGHAFPSGHTTTSAVVAVLVWGALGRRWYRSRWLPVARGVAVAWAVGVGLTRVYLGVHWPTDVVGGWLLALALAAAAATIAGRARGR